MTIIRPAEYPEGHPIPVHALPPFQGNPLDSYNVRGPIPEWLRGYWTAANQSLGWREVVHHDIFHQETWLSHGICRLRSASHDEYRAPGGLNHGLAILHEEMSKYLAPPMLEDAAEFLGDFVAMSEALSANQMQIRALEDQAIHLREEAGNLNYLQAEAEANLHQDLERARERMRQIEEERNDTIGQLEDIKGERRNLQAQLSTTAGELRVSQAAVQQLEADLAKAHCPQKATPQLTAVTTADPRAVCSQALASSISRMTLGTVQPCTDSTSADGDHQRAGHYRPSHCPAHSVEPVCCAIHVRGCSCHHQMGCSSCRRV